ncbi:hypothetical protein M569_06935, partial [Genlisea aurea]
SLVAAVFLLAVSAAAGDFIAASCRTTTYPAVCIRSLQAYASTIQKNRQQLVSAALAVSLQRSRSAKAFVSNLAIGSGLSPRERAAARDCVQQVADSVDRVSSSIREMRVLRTGDYAWHVSNLQTWMSAAITDYNGCMDGFSGRVLRGPVSDSVRVWMVNSIQVASNALALCN